LTATASSDALASGLPPGLAEVRDYYTSKVARHGPTPAGVDWPCARTQELRFAQLLRLCDFSAPFALNDLGCGYGALLAFLGRCHRGKQENYLGMDLSELMIRHASPLALAARYRLLLPIANGWLTTRWPAASSTSSSISLAVWERPSPRLWMISSQPARLRELPSPAPDGSPNIPQRNARSEQWLRYCE
jgi:hypothetical protein